MCRTVGAGDEAQWFVVWLADGSNADRMSAVPAGRPYVWQECALIANWQCVFRADTGKPLHSRPVSCLVRVFAPSRELSCFPLPPFVTVTTLPVACPSPPSGWAGEWHP
jgi:hypothetical protein